jgi:hypothetical protein
VCTSVTEEPVGSMFTVDGKKDDGTIGKKKVASLRLLFGI